MRGALSLHPPFVDVEDEATTPETLVCALVMRVIERDCPAEPRTERERMRLANVSAQWALALEDLAAAVRRRAERGLAA
jgi:hypothetical protein